MDILSFTVPGRPVPAARMTRRGKYIKRNAQRYLAFKDSVGWAARNALKKQQPFSGNVSVEIWAYIAGGRPGDVDNIAKAILDGMNGVIFFDDVQVDNLFVHRMIGKPQRAEVKVWTIDESA